MSGCCDEPEPAPEEEAEFPGVPPGLNWLGRIAFNVQKDEDSEVD